MRCRNITCRGGCRRTWGTHRLQGSARLDEYDDFEDVDQWYWIVTETAAGDADTGAEHESLVPLKHVKRSSVNELQSPRKLKG